MPRMLLVFGSINLDIAIRTRRLPEPGETVLGEAALVSPGGKGANQAHAAQRDGMTTVLAGAVGSDAFAEPALALLRAAGVDLALVQRLHGATGCATIAVDAAGENQIVVAPGANLGLRADHVPEHVLCSARAVLLQMETPPEQNALLLARARAAGCLTLLNNAPAQPLDANLLATVSLLVVNERELRDTALGEQLALGAPAHETLVALARRHGLTVVLTRGAEGVLASEAGAAPLEVAAVPVDVVDTTGAGDTFCGVLAAGLAQGAPLAAALRRANAAAALACTRAGAQAAQPERAEIDALLERHRA
jgi:ribokinase